MVGAAAGRMTFQAVRSGRDFQRAGDVEPFAADAGDAEGGVDQHRPDRADEDDEDRGEAGVLDGVERERHPGQRRDRLENLDERIERALEQRRHADQEAGRDRHQRREQEAGDDARQRIGELDADALVVRPHVVERVGEVLPDRLADLQRPRHGRGPLGGGAHQLGVFGIHRDRGTGLRLRHRDARPAGTGRTGRSRAAIDRTLSARLHSHVSRCQADGVRPSGALDGEARDVLFRLCRIELLAHDRCACRRSPSAASWPMLFITAVASVAR